MRVRIHIMTGTAAALALARWLRWLSVPLWLGASLTDVDLYAYYVMRHQHLSLRRAVRYYNALAGRRERARKLLHHPVVPLIALAGGRRHPAIAAFGSGVALHLLLDAYGKRRFKRLRSVLAVRSGGRWEQCGSRWSLRPYRWCRVSGSAWPSRSSIPGAVALAITLRSAASPRTGTISTHHVSRSSPPRARRSS